MLKEAAPGSPFLFIVAQHWNPDNVLILKPFHRLGRKAGYLYQSAHPGIGKYRGFCMRKIYRPKENGLAEQILTGIVQRNWRQSPW
jgi:hypothetical protein